MEFRYEAMVLVEPDHVACWIQLHFALLFQSLFYFFFSVFFFFRFFFLFFFLDV